MSPILALALADIRLLTRDKGALFFTLAFPMALAVFFGAIFGGGGSSRMEVALVNESPGPAAAAFANDIIADSALDVTSQWRARDDAPPTPLTRAQGETLVRRGAVAACIIIPATFDAGVRGVFSGNGMKVEAIVAPGRSAEAGLLTGKLNELAFRQLSRAFTDQQAMTDALADAKAAIPTFTALNPSQQALLGDMFDRIDAFNRSTPDRSSGDATTGNAPGMGGFRPVEVSMTELKAESNRPRSSWEISFPQGIVWALMGCVAGFGTSLNAERARGTMVRLSTAPISRHQILAGKALACFLTCLVAQLLLIALAVGVFGLIFGKFAVGNALMLGAALVLAAFGFTGLMMLLAGLTRTEAAASGMGRGIIIMLAMIGGGTVPLFLLPSWVQTASNVSPFKWVTLAIEGAVWRGFTWTEFVLPAAVLVGFGLAGFAIGTTCLARADRA